MNITVEQSLAKWIRSLSIFTGITIQAGQTIDEKPNDAAAVYVICSDTISPVKTLYLASVTIYITTPSLIDDSFKKHESLVSGMRLALYNPDGMSAHFPSGINCVGANVDRWSDSQEDEKWISSVSLSVGIADKLGSVI